MTFCYMAHSKYPILHRYYEVSMIFKAKVVRITENVIFKEVIEEKVLGQNKSKQKQKRVKI